MFNLKPPQTIWELYNLFDSLIHTHTYIYIYIGRAEKKFN